MFSIAYFKICGLLERTLQSKQYCIGIRVGIYLFHLEFLQAFVLIWLCSIKSERNGKVCLNVFQFPMSGQVPAPSYGAPAMPGMSFAPSMSVGQFASPLVMATAAPAPPTQQAAPTSTAQAQG